MEIHPFRNKKKDDNGTEQRIIALFREAVESSENDTRNKPSIQVPEWLAATLITIIVSVIIQMVLV